MQRPHGTSVLDVAGPALIKFSGAFLPPILVLLSGGGLHVYWLMPTLMPSDVWRALAGRLDGATVALGLLTDRKCTTGVERMMRLVTTFNHKEQVPRRVMLSTGDRQVGLPVQSAVKHLCSGQPTHRSPALTVEQSYTTYPCILNWARPSAEEAVPFPPPSATQICDVQFMDDVAQSRPNRLSRSRHGRSIGQLGGRCDA